MARLAARSGLRTKFGLKFIDDPIWPYLDIQKPLGVARLVGEAKQSVRDGQVLLRGQTEHFQAMRPSLLRDAEADAVQVRRGAERQLATAIRSIRAKRFQRAHLPALLQHYGFQTTWLDVVDNLFVATWFATHELQPVDGFYRIVPLVPPATDGCIYCAPAHGRCGAWISVESTIL